MSMDASEIRVGDRFEWRQDDEVWRVVDIGRDTICTIVRESSGKECGYHVRDLTNTYLWKRLPAPEAKADGRVKVGQRWEVSAGRPIEATAMSRRVVDGRDAWVLRPHDSLIHLTEVFVYDDPESIATDHLTPYRFVRLVRDVPEAEPAKATKGVVAQQLARLADSLREPAPVQSSASAARERVEIATAKLADPWLSHTPRLPQPPRPEPAKVACDPRCKAVLPCRREGCEAAMIWHQLERHAIAVTDKANEKREPAKPPRTGPSVPAWSGMGALTRTSWVAGSLLDRPSVRRGRR